MPLLILAMVLVVASANYLVQFPVNDWLTWVTLAVGDYGVKVVIALSLLLPWRVVARRG